MIKIVRVAAAIGVAALVMVAGCGEGGKGAQSSRVLSAEPIPTMAQLQSALLTPADLAGDFTVDDEGTQGGVIEPCAAASQASRDAAATLEFQVGTVLRRASVPPVETGAVYLRQYLLAEDPNAVDATFDSLRAGAEACYGQPLVPEEDYGTSDPYQLPAVGDERYGEYHVMGSDTPGYGMYLHMAVVRDGPILMLIDVFEFTGQEGRGPQVTAEDVAAIVTTAMGRLQ